MPREEDLALALLAEPIQRFRPETAKGMVSRYLERVSERVRYARRVPDTCFHFTIGRSPIEMRIVALNTYENEPPFILYMAEMDIRQYGMCTVYVLYQSGGDAQSCIAAVNTSATPLTAKMAMDEMFILASVS